MDILAEFSFRKKLQYQANSFHLKLLEFVSIHLLTTVNDPQHDGEVGQDLRHLTPCLIVLQEDKDPFPQLLVLKPLSG